MMWVSILLLTLSNVFSCDTETCNRIGLYCPIKKFPISSGKVASLTTFDDNVFECIGSDTPPEFALAVNPILLGYSAEDYKRFNDNGDTLPWCGSKIKITVNGKSFVGVVIDTCNPLDGETFPDPITGEPIGGKCDYPDVLDFYGPIGQKFLMDATGDDFYQGPLVWNVVE